MKMNGQCLLSLPKGGVPPPAPVTVKFRPHGERYLPTVYLQNRTYELPPPYPGVKLPPPWTNIGPGIFIINPPFTHMARGKYEEYALYSYSFLLFFSLRKENSGQNVSGQTVQIFLSYKVPVKHNGCHMNHLNRRTQFLSYSSCKIIN
jgi:hypothetical protein